MSPNSVTWVSAGGSGSTADAIEAINYAASFKDGSGNPLVRITNNSWGGGQKSTALQDAIANSGALFVAAAGNSGSSSKMYPAGYNLANIISVAATDHNDQLASWSNYGSDWVDLGAPGVNILSSVPGGYATYSGTSMAAPHVAGVAALVRAQNPSWSNAQIKDRLLATVDPLAALAGKTLTGGRLNVRAAVGAGELPADSIAPAAVTDLARGIPTANTVTLSWTATGDDASVRTAYLYDVRYLANQPISDANWKSATPAEGEPLPGGPGFAESFTLHNLQAGTSYYIGLKVADEVGNFSGLSNVVVVTTLTSPWKTEVVDSTGNVGFYNALAYAPADGNPSIGYSDATNDDVKLAHWNAGTSQWDIQIVDPGPDVAKGVDLAYDASRNPSLSYAGGGKIKFARWTGSSWETSVVEGNNADTESTSLAYDLEGSPSIAYCLFGSGGGLKLARRIGTSWQTEVVDPGAGARYKSLAYDSVGNAAIAYSDDIDKDGWLDTLKFAHWNGSTWQIEIVETGTVGFGVFASLAFEPAFEPGTDYPLIAHKGDDPNRWARFARWNGTAWEIESFDGSQYSGTGASLAYDNNTGTAFVGYHNYHEVMVARRSGSAVWEREVVDGLSEPSWRTSLKLAPDGNPSLSYSDSTAADLKFARRQPQTGQILINPIAGLVTTETGGTASFAVVLDTPPTANVTIPVSSSDLTEGTVSTSSLTFTSVDWNVPQTVTVTGVDDPVFDGNVGYTIVLGPATSEDLDFNGLNPTDVSVTNTDDDIPPTKFYVVNDASQDQTYEYTADGGPVESYSLDTGNTAPRGAATTVAGERTWVVDANRKVYVYDTSGGLLGSWTAGTLNPNATVEDITVWGSDVWIVDAKSDKVFRYSGAASRLKDSQNATSSFKLNSGNTSPKGMVTDGTSLWVVNDSTTDKVFKYTLSGSLVGSWTISTSGAASPTGLTIDPTGASQDIWIVDSGTDKVYQYANARGLTSDSQSAAATFALAAGNTNPQGIADPPPPGSMLPTGRRAGRLTDAALASLVLYDPEFPSKPARGKGLAMVPAVDLALMDLAS